MALDDQQKKQALILLLLVGVLGVVFYIFDPLELFKKDSVVPPEVKKKIDEQAKLANANAASDKTDPDKTLPKPNTPKRTEIDIKKTTMNYDELIPEVVQLDIMKQFNAKTRYKDEIFVNLSSTETKGPIGPDLPITSYSSSNNVNQVQFGGKVESVNTDSNFLKKGDEFYFDNIQYRILNIDISYDPETKTQVRVLIMDLNGKDTKLNEYTIYYPKIK